MTRPVTKHDRHPIRVSSLLIKNIWCDGNRTTVRLERYFWQALGQISTETGRSRKDVVDIILKSRPPYMGTTAALRIGILAYFREAEASLSRWSVGELSKIFLETNQVLSETNQE